jgi:hypothetical protein
VQARVPFSFTVGHNQLPSGTYTITRDPSGLVHVQSIDREFNAFITATVEPESMRGDKLVFHKYGDRYFLSGVSTSVLSMHVPVSRLEKKARNHEAEPVAGIQVP